MIIKSGDHHHDVIVGTDEISNWMYSMGSSNGIVVLIWTPSDVIKIIRKNTGVEINEETARNILMSCESEIHERLWHQAELIFEEEMQNHVV
ncbi:hypothetical protein EBR57_03140 [bacterium]|nr:hypothetical protein [bacterium]